MKKISFIALVFLISLGSITDISALENNINSCPMGAAYGFNGNYGISAMILSWTFSILIIILIIAGIYWLIKSANNKTNGGKK